MKNVAVIDIGSNSVRLVIYDGLKRSPFTIFNEKSLCGLAVGLEKSKKLHPEGRKEAEQALDRFISLSKKNLPAKNLFIFATSAVRDAIDGPDFVKTIETKHKVSVRILSEKDEARLAAYGIRASIAQPPGVVGDLGGGSFELAAVSKSELDACCSFPIGPLRFSEKTSAKTHLKTIDSCLKQFKVKDPSFYEHFYAVGGAFRSLAKIHMERKNYPLKILHHYTVTSEELLSTLHIVQRMSDSALQKIADMPKKRAKYLPYTAALLNQYIERFAPKWITFSSHGVREGLLFEQLPSEEKLLDPLITGCNGFIDSSTSSISYGDSVFKWICALENRLTLFPKHLLYAACILSEVSLKEHPSYRAQLAYQRILDAPFSAITHKERFILGKTLFCRYEKKPNADIEDTMHALLTEEEIQQSQIVGAALRVAKVLSLGNAKLLEKTQLTITDDRLTLHLKKDMASIYGESVEKRLCFLGVLLGCSSFEIKNG
jgi:exopolyphosphatase/guanosine-5'-triphosphate,3'-diphosphate pyrophosphatase